MYERFTAQARRVIVLAQAHAQSFNHYYIGSEHILIGLISEGTGVAATTLDHYGVSQEAVSEEVLKQVGEGERRPNGHIPFTPRAKKLLEYTLREALQLGHTYVGTEHLLLGLIRLEDGVAASVLEALRVEKRLLQRSVVDLLNNGTISSPPSSGPVTVRNR